MIQDLPNSTKKSTRKKRYNPDGYGIWRHMRSRCNNPDDPSYPRYGGRGIAVCKEWDESFKIFIDDMGPRPSKKHSIDRIDNNGNYTKENCRWANAEIQNNNRSDNKPLTYNGKTQTLTQWERELKLKRNVIATRLLRYEENDPRIFKPSGEILTKKYEFNGEKVYLSRLCEEYGIERSTVRHRLKRGWTMFDALTKERRGGSGN